MAKFASALALLLATVSSVSALRISESLQNVVNKETGRVPSLRRKDMERKNVLQSKFAAMAVKPSGKVKRHLEEDVDYAWDQTMDQNSIGFDITSYSIKYTQCSTVQTYSDDLAADENVETVLAAERFALFRLCPKDQCSSYSNGGCSTNYGEYVVSLDQFLVAMLEYQETRVAGYCEYCQNCAATEAAKSFWTNLYTTRATALATAQASYATWYTTYLESYTNTNGNQNSDSYSNVDANTAAQQYYQKIRNSNNYANQYVQSNYGYSGSSSSSSSSSSSGYASGSSSASQYQWTNEANWQFQNSQNRVYSNQDSWHAMASQGGTWFGRPIMNGYYENGAFVQDYGYFNIDGSYISLSDDEIEWDENLYGEQPSGWNAITVDTESCNVNYAGSCYNQFDACMQILEDQDYQVTQSSSSGNSYNGQQAAQESYANRNTLKDFLGCVEVDPTSQYGNGNAQSAYAQQQNYQQQQVNYNCYDGDEACQKMQSYTAQMYEYQAQKSANRRYYVGPHCGSNGKDITLAVYSDQFCSVLDSESTVEKVLGYNPVSSSLTLFPTECMACFPEEVCILCISLCIRLFFLCWQTTKSIFSFSQNRSKKHGTKMKKFTLSSQFAQCCTNIPESATSI